MGFLIRVEDENGQVVDQIVADGAFNPVRSRFDSQAFPILGRLDPYGDTAFDFHRCKMLENGIRSATDLLETAGILARSAR